MNEIADPGYDGHFGTLWPALRAQCGSRTVVAWPWHFQYALNQSGKLGQTLWSSGSPWLHWISPHLPQLSKIHVPVWSAIVRPGLLSLFERNSIRLCSNITIGRKSDSVKFAYLLKEVIQTLYEPLMLHYSVNLLTANMTSPPLYHGFHGVFLVPSESPGLRLEWPAL